MALNLLWKEWTPSTKACLNLFGNNWAIPKTAGIQGVKLLNFPYKVRATKAISSLNSSLSMELILVEVKNFLTYFANAERITLSSTAQEIYQCLLTMSANP